jgi:hypothetical protein
MLGETTAMQAPPSIALHEIGVVLAIGIAVISVVILFQRTAPRCRWRTASRASSSPACRP